MAELRPALVPSHQHDGPAGVAQDSFRRQHDAAADPGADCEHNEALGRALARAEPILPERREVCVVVHQDGHVEAPGQRLPDRHVLPILEDPIDLLAEVRRPPHHPPRIVDVPRDRHAYRLGRL